MQAIMQARILEQKNPPPSRWSSKTYGIRSSNTYSRLCSGAYCAATIIALLDLPLALPHDAKKAREAGFETLTDGLAEYLSRCKTTFHHVPSMQPVLL